MAAALIEVRPLPPPFRLYRHAVECVFAFVSLSELPTLLVVSREWQLAVLSMKPLGASVDTNQTKLYANPLDRLAAICNSRLRRHVQHLDSCLSFVHPSAMRLLSLNMPHLEGLAVLIAVSAVPPMLPLQLRKLEVQVRAGEEDDEDCVIAFLNQTMHAIGSLPLLTDLAIVDGLPHAVSLSVLQRLPQLRKLHIAVFTYEWSDEHVAVLRSLPQLESVGLSGVELPLLSRVLAQPHSLRWKEFDGFGVLTEPVMQLLLTLPVTKLNADLAMPHIDQLTQLKTLDDLKLSASTHVPLDRPRIFHKLASLVQLRKLQLVDDINANALHFTDNHLRAALSRLTQLQSLSISNATQLTSLSFLTQGALPRTLTELCLWNFRPRVPVAELQHVLTLSQLHSLELVDVFDAPIAPACELSFKPPMRARLFPNLNSFHHCWS